jgi:hypothetical protein
MIRVTYETVCDGCGKRCEPVVHGLTAMMAVPPPAQVNVLQELHLCDECMSQARRTVLGSSGKPWGA